MNKMKKVAGLVAGLVIGCVVTPIFGAEAKTKTWDQVPAAVQATILANGGKAGPVDKERKLIDGKAVYEAPAKDKNGNMVDLVVLEDGKLVEVKTDAASDFAKDQAAKKAAKKATPEVKGSQGGSNVDIKVPAAVTKTFKKTFPKGQITKLDVDEENGVTVYDIEFTDGAIEKETDITADGTMLEFTVVVDAKAVPKAAMTTIRKAAEGATMKRIEDIKISYETKDGKAIKLSKPITHYAVELAKGDQTAEIVVAPDGTVVEPAKWSGGKEAKPEKKEAKGGKKAAKKVKGEPAGKNGKIDGFAGKFEVNKANLTNVGKNPYFIPLEPGYRLVLEGGGTTLTVTVRHKTKVVDGVETRVVEEREEKDGQPLEISQNYFAIDKTTNAVYYFGEDVDIYKDGKVVSHEGAWLSGVGGAKFGMMMPGKPKVGDKFQQEIAPKVAMDRCEIAAIGEAIKTPAGTFKNCLRTKEGSTLEPGSSDKAYAPGVGLVKDDEFLLVRIAKTVLKKKAAKGGEKAEKGEKPSAATGVISLDKAPKAVQATVKKLLGKGKLLKLALEADGNYELDYQVNGIHQAAIISAAGKVQEEEVTVAASTLPKAVTEAVKELYPRGKITLAEKSTTKNGMVYELRVAVDKKSHTITVSPKGKVQ